MTSTAWRGKRRRTLEMHCGSGRWPDAITARSDREFRLPKISYLDFKHIEMDRVLHGLFERLAHNGYPESVPRRRAS